MPADLHDRLRRRAAEERVTLSTYVLRLLERDVGPAVDPGVAGRLARPGAGPRTRTSPGRWTGRGAAATRGPGVYCVIDAGALVELLLRTLRAESVQAAVDDRRLVAPAVIDAEILSALRGLERNRTVTAGPRRPGRRRPAVSPGRAVRAGAAAGAGLVPARPPAPRTTRSTSPSRWSWTARWSPPTTGSRRRGCPPPSSTPEPPPARGGPRGGPRPVARRRRFPGRARSGRPRAGPAAARPGRLAAAR